MTIGDGAAHIEERAVEDCGGTGYGKRRAVSTTISVARRVGD